MSAPGGSDGGGGRSRDREARDPGPSTQPGVIRVRERTSFRRESATIAGPDVPGSRVPLSRERIAGALRSVESKREVPHLYLGTTVDLGPCMALLEERDGVAGQRPRVEVADVFLAACAGALAECGGLNARFAGDAIETWEEIHLAFSVAVGDSLAWPVLRLPGRLPIDALASLRSELARRAVAGELAVGDESDATFSVALLGETGVECAQAVIRPPQAAILAVGGAVRRPVVRHQGIEPGWVVSLGLSCDRRVVEEPLGGRFLGQLRRRIEQPAMLLGD